MRAPGLLRDLAIAAAALAVMLALPPLTGSAALRDFVVYVCAHGLLAMSLNLLIGYTGLVSFGHAMFFASGAYAFGLMMQSGRFSLPAAFALAVLASALLALVVGAICVRLKEIYFAFLTLAFQMLLYSLILSWVSITGGDQGLLGGIPRPPFLGIDLGDPRQFYVFCCVVFVLCILLMRKITQSPFGYSLRMIRDNPDRTNFLGINVFRTKLIIFVIAGSFASVGGILLALFVSGAYPNFGYWTTSGEAIFMIMLGGASLFLGPAVGAALLTLLNDLVTTYTGYYGLVLGIIILLFALGLRRGLLEFLLDAFRPRRRPLPAARPQPAGAEAGRAAPVREPVTEAKP